MFAYQRLLLALFSIAVIAAAGVFGIVRFAQSGEDEVAVSVNGERITVEEVNASIRNTEAVLSLSAKIGQPFEDKGVTDRNAMVDKMIDDALFDEEAKVRGISCSDAEVQNTFRQQYLAAGEVGVVTIIASGFAPVAYLDTPESERTPSTVELVDSYLEDEKVLAALHRVCRKTKLNEAIGAETLSPADPNLRTDAILALKQELRSKARIQRSPGY